MGADQHTDWRASVASTLQWWRDAGVDCEIDDAPRHWSTHAPRADALPNVIEDAALVPSRPRSLDEFAAWRIGPGMPEATWPGDALGARGDATAGVMIVVDNPDRGDDAAGTLLSGPPGQLFDRMLAAIGRDRHSVYIAPLAVKRPPAGRVPYEKVQLLADLMRHHLALAAPKRVLAMGNAASRALTGLDVADARGSLRIVNHDGGTSAVVASFHPRFLLERAVAKAESWKDLQLLIGGLE